MKKWFFGFGVIGAIAVIAALATGAWLVGTGVLTRTKAKAVLHVLRGEPAPAAPAGPGKEAPGGVGDREQTLVEQREQQTLELSQLSSRLTLLREEYQRDQKRIEDRERDLTARETRQSALEESYRAERGNENWKTLVTTFQKIGAEAAAPMLLRWTLKDDPKTIDVRAVTDLLRALPDAMRAGILVAMFEQERALRTESRLDQIIEIERALGQGAAPAVPAPGAAATVAAPGPGKP